MLRSEDVVLRPLVPKDVERIFETAQDVEMLGLAGIPVRPYTQDAIRKMFDGMLADPATVLFAIEHDGSFAGEVMLKRIDPVSRTAELGIAIEDRALWGKRLGSQAVALAVEFGFRQLNLRKIWLQTHSANPRAIRSYEQVGFTEEGRLREHDWVDGQYTDRVYMALFAPERG